MITIFSQYGEVMDVNLPRDKNTGKTKGFGFLMYEDQRSTILAVDNLNGAKVLERTLRVDHVKDYKQPKTKGEDGEWQDRAEQSLNAKPELVVDDGAVSDSSEDSAPPIDPEDPMYEYLVAKRKEEKAAKKARKGKSKAKGKHKDETPEERRARKERKKLRKAMGKSEAVRAVEELLNSFEGATGGRAERRHSKSRSRSPHRMRDRDDRRSRSSPERRRSQSRNRSPVREGRSVRGRELRSRTPPTKLYVDRRENGRYDRADDRRSYGRDQTLLSRRHGDYD